MTAKPEGSGPTLAAVAGRVVRTLPVTTVFVASLLGFMLSGMLPSPWSLVVFYLLALPYYLIALMVMVLGQAVGLPGHWLLAMGLCVAFDLVIVGLLRRGGSRS